MAGILPDMAFCSGSGRDMKKRCTSRFSFKKSYKASSKSKASFLKGIQGKAWASFIFYKIVIHMQKMLHNAVCSGSFGNLNEAGRKKYRKWQICNKNDFFLRNRNRIPCIFGLIVIYLTCNDSLED